MGYHVRVLVPCYKEDLEIVAKTIQAAYNARLPDNCSRTIYLCDDGKDKRKRKWCATFKILSMLHNPVCMLCKQPAEQPRYSLPIGRRHPVPPQRFERV